MHQDNMKWISDHIVDTKTAEFNAFDYLVMLQEVYEQG
ncbi:hypothetical protein VRK_34740 [Vibrio sp. MEBiC08052]|nr:hypothetical protein VRK_34740 [Vibrio sp. MEBiC08052]